MQRGSTHLTREGREGDFAEEQEKKKEKCVLKKLPAKDSRNGRKEGKKSKPEAATIKLRSAIAEKKNGRRQTQVERKG